MGRITYPPGYRSHNEPRPVTDARARDERSVLGGRGVRLPFTLLGIPLLLDWSFLVVLPLMAYMIGTNVVQYARSFHVAGAESLGEPAVRYLLGLLAAVGLFVCVVLHELGHAVTARLYHVNVKSITLWFLGGMAYITEMPKRPGGEAVVAIVGPLVSFAIGGLLWVMLALMPGAHPGVAFLVAYLAVVNMSLGLFNLIPALPLDGGRILRSLLALAMPHVRATQVAGAVSKVIAVLLGVAGLLTTNLFLVFIAFFVYMGVQGEARQSVVADVLQGVTIRELMSREVRTVPLWISVRELTQLMLDEHHSGFPVVNEQGTVVGMVTVRELASTHPEARVADVMRPEPQAIAENAPAIEGLRLLQGSAMHLLVIDDYGRIVGIITAHDLMRAIQVRTVGLDWVPSGYRTRRAP